MDRLVHTCCTKVSGVVPVCSSVSLVLPTCHTQAVGCQRAVTLLYLSLCSVGDKQAAASCACMCFILAACTGLHKLQAAKHDCVRCKPLLLSVSSRQHLHCAVACLLEHLLGCCCRCEGRGHIVQPDAQDTPDCLIEEVCDGHHWDLQYAEVLYAPLLVQHQFCSHW